jgi:hypothetical protein
MAYHMLTSVEEAGNPLISTVRANFPLYMGVPMRQHHRSTYYVLTDLIMWTGLKKKIRLEFYDRTGVRHSIAMEGELTTDRVRRLLEYAEIVSGHESNSIVPEPQESKMSRLLDVINTRHADEAFDSREVWKEYRETWGDDFSLGAVSTYLSRLSDRGTLERTGSPAHWEYRLRHSPTVTG